MVRNFLPSFIGIAMTKSQFCWSTGCTPYILKKTIEKRKAKYEKMGLTKYSKMLMPSVVIELLADTGLKVDVDLYAQYVAGQRGQTSPIVSE